MTIQEAYEFAVMKWQYIVNNNGSSGGLSIIYPQLNNFISGCSYCELYLEGGCVGCPLNLQKIDYLKHIEINDTTGCYEDNHPYNSWLIDSTKANAQAVLDLIIKNKP